MILSVNVTLTQAQNRRFTFETGGAINVSDYQWSIAGNIQGQSPNILSELTFKKITSVGFFLSGAYKPLKYWEINAYYQKNNVVSGSGIDVDYLNDNRTNATYNEAFSSNKGQLETFRGGGSFCFLHRRDIDLSTGIFYASTIQNFHILNSDVGNLNSTYRASWKSVELSINGRYKIIKKLFLQGSLSYDFIKYSSKANWNLIEIFMHPLSFEQHSNGRGISGEMGLNYRLNSLLSLTLNGTVGNTKVFKGTDKSYLKNNTQMLTQFNGSRNNFYGFKIGITISF